MGQGKNASVPSQSDAPEELHDSYFRSMTIKHAIPKTADMHIPMASYGKRSRERGGVSISLRGHLRVNKADELNGSSENFCCSRKLVPSLPHVRFLGHHLLTLKSPVLIDERFSYLS